MKPLFGLIGLLLLIGLACEDNGSELDGEPLGVFRYTAFDSSLTVVDRGWLSLRMKNLQSVRGDWMLENTGSGQLAGFLNNDTLYIDLHPQYKDHNLILFGTLQGKYYHGIWSWLGFPGVMSSGTFEAMRI